jgi:hypothetical protein
MKVKITRGKAIALVLFTLIILLAIAVYPYLPLPVYSANYYGTIMNFRVNLKDAENVPVYPNEQVAGEEIMNQLVENITIAFKPGTGEENAHYALETSEIVYKLAIAFQKRFGYMPKVNVINVTSYDNLPGKIQNPIIALIHPVYSNETSVRLDGHVFFIAGKNSTSTKEQLKNFDLATVKFLMTALGLKLNN